jgi:hypothetical protein
VDVAPPPQAFEEPGPLEEGPAFGKVAAAAPAADDWPMLRADASRSCAARGEVPDPLAVLWRKPLATRPGGWIVSTSWRAQHHHNQTISAPVVAHGKVFVALIDKHQVVALDAARGDAVWRYTANARLDSPPTIHKGLCLFGCRDGWVYALRAADGQLAWRRRIAPLDQRILVYGQLESRWPVIGSVLLDGNRACATAGHEPRLGILLWEFEPATGKTLAFGTVPRLHFPNDILVRGDDGGVYLNRVAVVSSPAAAQPAGLKLSVVPYMPPGAAHLNPLDTPILSSADTTSLGPRGGLYLRQVLANRWTWRAARLVGFTSRGYRPGTRDAQPGFRYGDVPAPAVFCLDASNLAGEAGSALLWQAAAEDVWALALAGRHVIVAGPRVASAEPAPAAPQPTAADLLAAIRQADAQPARPAFPLPVGKSADHLWEKTVLSAMIAPWSIRRQDPLAAPGFVRILDAADGKPVQALDLPSAVVQDGIAVAAGRVYLTTADGAVCCLGVGASVLAE